MTNHLQTVPTQAACPRMPYLTQANSQAQGRGNQFCSTARGYRPIGYRCDMTQSRVTRTSSSREVKPMLTRRSPSSRISTMPAACAAARMSASAVR